MTYLWIVGAVAAVVLLFWVILVATASRRSVQSFGRPTPEEARIEERAKLRAREIVNEGERRVEEVENADRDALLNALRDEVRK